MLGHGLFLDEIVYFAAPILIYLVYRTIRDLRRSRTRDPDEPGEHD